MSASPRRLILASTSVYRRALLDRLRLPYEAIAPDYEERPTPGLDPITQLETHARGKAHSLARAHPDAVIIGSDQGLICDGMLLGKPGTIEGACAQLGALRGGVHRLVTAVAVLDAASGERRAFNDIHRLHFRALTDAEIRAYVELDRPLDCAGSFKLESLGVALFERIEGNDSTGIIGLPLMPLIDLLAPLGLHPLRQLRGDNA